MKWFSGKFGKGILFGLLINSGATSTVQAGMVQISGQGSNFGSLSGVFYSQSSEDLFQIGQSYTSTESFNGFDLAGSVTSLASLPAGVLKTVAVLSSVREVDGEPVFLGGTMQSFALLTETMHFVVAGAAPDQITSIGILLSVEGELVVPESRGSAMASFVAIIDSNSATLGGIDRLALRQRYTSGTVLTDENVGFTADGVAFAGTLDLVGPETDILLYMSLSCEADSNGSCFFGNSAHFNFAPLPTNITFSSDSGVFLSSVPVPGTFGFLTVGVLSLGLYRRARRCSGGNSRGCAN